MKNQNTFSSNYSEQETHRAHQKFLSWGGIVAGAFAGVGLSFLLNMLSVSVGMSAFTTDAEGLMTLAVGGFVGMLIGVIVVMFISGMIAGSYAKSFGHRSCGGALHGFITWCLGLLITIAFATAVGNFMTNNFYAMAKGADSVISAAMNTESGSKAADNLVQNAQNAVENSDNTAGDNNQNSTAQDENTHDDTANKVEKTAKDAAHAAGGAAFAVFILFLVSALASILGGWVGASSGKED